MAYVYETVLGALRGLRYQNEATVIPKHPKRNENYLRLYYNVRTHTLNAVGTRSTLQCFAFPRQYIGMPNLHPRLAFELSCLDVAEQLGYKPNADVLRPILMDLLLDADFPRFRQLKEQELELDVPESNCVQYLLTAANKYLKG